jgi:hypothetical protein
LYFHLFSQKNEIQTTLQEFLATSAIHPSTNIPSFSSIIMVLNKEGTWDMCHDLQALKNIIIKDNFPIPIIDDFLDELKGAHFFTKLNLLSSYHQIFMKEMDICLKSFHTHEGHY